MISITTLLLVGAIIGLVGAVIYITTSKKQGRRLKITQKFKSEKAETIYNNILSNGSIKW